jgi:hypothetical protein
MIQMECFFTIIGDKESGNYLVTENGKSEPLFVISGMRYGGLKEARKRIGNYLKNNGHSINSVFVHQCIKPNRKNNPKHRWTVEEYLNGVPVK